MYKDLTTDVIHVDCATWKSLSISKLKDKFEYTCSQAVWHAPSLVIFDGLDELIHQEQENTNSARPRQLAYMFQSFTSKLFSANVLFMATGTDFKALHKKLPKSQVFAHKVRLVAPNKDQRIEIFSGLFESSHKSVQSSCKSINLDGLARRMDGYALVDIKNVFDRALMECALRKASGSSDVDLNYDDFTKVLDTYKPTSLVGAKTQESPHVWESIGGMNDTKSVLLQTLQWPTLYPELFANSPIRLRSGILLYGYPGCGKTILAGSVAKKCGLNFISIKGPELLNKYIGASEQSVRDLFERAKACRPCLLFLDEFDSIAPRRGQDNTGVTDRVVNQLLTELDGAEGLSGVYVLAGISF
jgi:peroxin-1